MYGYIAKDKRGWTFLPADSLTASTLERESIRGPLHWWEAYKIEVGTTKSGMVHATAGDFRVTHWPEGGNEGYVNVEGPGWVVDANYDMPPLMYEALLATCRAADCVKGGA